MDVEARQLALQYLDRSRKAQTASKNLLVAARKANMAAGLNPTNANTARRAVLARDAYNARMNAEAGVTMAAYALLAEREGTRAITAQQALQRTQDARQRSVLVETAKGAQLRRNIMLQASQAAAKALDTAPGLPASIVGNVKEAASATQVTPGAKSTYRPDRFKAIANSFFPDDIRAAASSLKGLDCASCDAAWEQKALAAIETDAAAVRSAAQERASKVASQEPGAAALAQEAEGLIAQLRQQYDREMASTGTHPWLHIAGASLATLFFIKVVLK